MHKIPFGQLESKGGVRDAFHAFSHRLQDRPRRIRGFGGKIGIQTTEKGGSGIKLKVSTNRRITTYGETVRRAAGRVVRFQHANPFAVDRKHGRRGKATDTTADDDHIVFGFNEIGVSSHGQPGPLRDDWRPWCEPVRDGTKARVTA